ncbi:hypothetical protein [Streptomyces sp. NBC_01268]|uniref:hypothetical protein n=1 Tax=unclassified Streptomyces TaxID=2593676 RepID=UPI002E302BD1|nr:hypothetical protein [Streptomyces sp. NBC_01268]
MTSANAEPRPVGQVHAVTCTDGCTSAEDAPLVARIAEPAGTRRTIVHGGEAEPPSSGPTLDAPHHTTDRACLSPDGPRPSYRPLSRRGRGVRSAAAAPGP